MGDGEFATQDEAIRAALDDMKEGDTLFVHEQHCRKYERIFFGLFRRGCTCNPRVWTY